MKHADVAIRNAAIRADAQAGMSQEALAAKHGVQLQSVYLVLKVAGIRVPRRDPKAPKPPKPPRVKRAPLAVTERELKMASMFRQGVILEKIGQQFGVTRERVRQILKKQGLVGADGGRQKSKARQRANAAATADAKAIVAWGVPHAELVQLRKDRVIHGFKQQRRNASDRGIDFRLSFPEWLSIWQASGKLDQRGRGHGKYVMSRISDAGCYELGNVHVQLADENNREAVKKWRGQPAKVNRGVHLLYPGTRKPWFAKAGKVSLGRHETEAEAVAARDIYFAANPTAKRQGNVRGYTHIRGKEGRADRFQVMVGKRYIGSFKSADAALAARAAFLDAATV